VSSASPRARARMLMRGACGPAIPSFREARPWSERVVVPLAVSEPRPERAMMQGQTFPVRVRLPDPALRADLRDFLHRWGCVTYELNDDTLEVIVPDAAAERQGAASSISTSRPGEHIPRPRAGTARPTWVTTARSTSAVPVPQHEATPTSPSFHARVLRRYDSTCEVLYKRDDEVLVDVVRLVRRWPAPVSARAGCA
jgi:hypothetical protein